MIRSLAAIKARLDANYYSAPTTTDIARLIAALEKCQEQRNMYRKFIQPVSEAVGIDNGDDAELERVLDGKDE